MQYKTPKCDCGKELKYIEEVLYRHECKITAKCKLSMRVQKVQVKTLLNRLECSDPQCNNMYDFTYDTEGRIIRLDKL